MGLLRSAPERNQMCSLKDVGEYFCVSGSICGWQLFMSNFDFSFHYSENVHVMGILEGHAGPEVAQFCFEEIQNVIMNCGLMKLEQYQAAIENLCVTLDFLIKENHQKINKIRASHKLPELPECEYTPASASLIICIIDKQLITIGNLGQSKAYVSYKNSPQTCVLISANHVIQNDEDIEGIKKRGGFVANNLVNGKYLHTKCIGNLQYKNLNDQSKSIIGFEPSVYTLQLEYLNAIVMGSSGFWERPEVVLRRVLEEKRNPLEQKENIRGLVQELIAQSPEDEFGRQNMTVQAVFMKH